MRSSVLFGLPIVLVTVAIVALSSCASTPPITDSRGDVVPGSIASLEKIRILDTDQWVLMRGKSADAPVLLWLAGGPGGSEIGRTRDYLSGLEDHFVFVNWEQPGTGKSFGAIDSRKVSYEVFIEHTIAVTEWLIDRFDTDRVYLAGHSWGTIVGLMAASRRPDLYHAYIAVAQQVDFVENDVIGYDLVMEAAASEGDKRTISRLEKNGPPPYAPGDRGKYAYLFQRVFRYSPPSGGPGINEMSIFTPREYTIFDTINLIRSLLRGVDYIYPQLTGIDFRKDIPHIDVPIFFVTGRYDYTCVAEMSYEYYEMIEAPIKRHYWFESSGHESCYEDPERFERILIDDVLTLTANRNTNKTDANPVTSN